MTHSWFKAPKAGPLRWTVQSKKAPQEDSGNGSRTIWGSLSNSSVSILTHRKNYPKADVSGIPQLIKRTTITESARNEERKRKRVIRKDRAMNISDRELSHRCPTCGKYFRTRIGQINHLWTQRTITGSRSSSQAMDKLKIILIYFYVYLKLNRTSMSIVSFSRRNDEAAN